VLIQYTRVSLISNIYFCKRHRFVLGQWNKGAGEFGLNFASWRREDTPMAETKTQEEAIGKIAGLIKDTRIAMLTNITASGALHSRPMAMMDVEFDGDLWFFTGKTSPKVEEIKADSRVNVAFSEPSSQNYVSLSGTGHLVVDQALNEKYWKEEFKAWFPKGLEDPELALLKIEVDGAEYWDAPSSVVAHVTGFVKATLTGKPADPGDHAKVEL
jgi:general stress protein 26